MGAAEVAEWYVRSLPPQELVEALRIVSNPGEGLQRNGAELLMWRAAEVIEQLTKQEAADGGL